MHRNFTFFVLFVSVVVLFVGGVTYLVDRSYNSWIEQKREGIATINAKAWAEKGDLYIEVEHINCGYTSSHIVPCALFLKDGRILSLECDTRRNSSGCQMKAMSTIDSKGR